MKPPLVFWKILIMNSQRIFHSVAIVTFGFSVIFSSGCDKFKTAYDSESSTTSTNSIATESDNGDFRTAIEKANAMHDEALASLSTGFSADEFDYDSAIQASNILISALPNATELEIDLYADKMYLVFYNAACGHSLNGNTTEALDCLQRSLDFGWTDIDHMQNDVDLVHLRATDEYDILLARMQASAGTKNVAEARRLIASSPKFPFQTTLTALDGSTISTDALKGKVVMIDIWGTWCPPCRSQIPALIALQKKYGEQGLQIIGINYEGDPNEEHADAVREFSTTHAINYPCAMGDRNTQDQIKGFSGYPTVLFLDRAGDVKLMKVGLTSYDKLEAIVEVLLETS